MPGIQRYLAEIGARGGRKSRRTLDPETARQMVRVREARRAFRRFRVICFWSYDPAYRVTAEDIPWVAEQLMRQGNREAFRVGSRLLPRRVHSARVVALRSPEASEAPRPASITERLALLASLSTQTWLFSGQPLPSSARAQMPVTFRPLRDPRADTSPQ